MSNEIKSVPQLRFPEFTNPWEQRKLNDLALIKGGGTPSSTVSNYWGGNIDWFTPTEINNNGYVHNSVRKITKEGLEHSSATLLPPGTVLMTSRAGIGKMAILQSKAATNQGFQSIIPNENLDSYFLYSMQEKISEQANKLASGSTFTEISGKKVEQLIITISTEQKEQIKIGEFFKQLDNLITVNQREGAKLIELKKHI